MELLNFLLSTISSLTSFTYIFVPVLVMGIFVLVSKFAMRRIF